MHVMVLHNAVSETAVLEDQDVLVQREAIADALLRLGHAVACFPCTLDLLSLRDHLEAARPGVVFNLVESLGGSDQLICLAPALLDTMRVPYTGVGTEGLFWSTNKVRAKERLAEAGLPTPPYARGREALKPPYLIKAVWEHASFGMDDEALVTDEGRPLCERLLDWEARWGRGCFAERYVEGREFNLSLLDGPDGVEVLPPAEIDFADFPAAKPRLVGYRAKWEAGSFEYHHTPRRFEFPAGDGALLDELGDLARTCWRLFGLRGYARVDFRVDGRGRPWILEVNANPCLSPDAGFAAALERAAIPYERAIGRIVGAALTAHVPGGAEHVPHPSHR